MAQHTCMHSLIRSAFGNAKIALSLSAFGFGFFTAYKLISQSQRANNTHPPEKYSVFIQMGCYEQIQHHCESESGSHEVIGLLIGDHFSDTSGPYTHIFGAVTGSYNSNMVHVKFTKEGLLQVNSRFEDFKITQTKCPIDGSRLRHHRCGRCDYHVSESKIVGWYHSHPGHGSFMSQTDLDTQMQYKVAVVIDPINDQVRAWQTIKGEIVEASLYKC